MPKKEYSVELAKLLEFIKINNPTHLQNIKSKELNQEEREIYMDARKKKAKADRNKLHRLMKKSTYAKSQMLEFLRYFIYGWIILIAAIPVNLIAKKIGLVTWYDFLVFKKSIGFLDGIFMFIVYPLIFGAIIYFLRMVR